MKQQSNVVSVQSTCAVRPAQPCDCEAMADLARQLGYECTGEEVRKRLRDMQNSNQYAVFVAELPGRQIAGWIGAFLFRSIETGSCVEINGLVVDESIRSRGIGKILLSAAEEWARSISFDVISVHSNVTRDRAHLRGPLAYFGLTGHYSGPEVGFEEISIDFLQARLSGV